MRFGRFLVSVLVFSGLLAFGDFTTALAAVGRIPAEFNVSSTGQSQYSIPLDLPLNGGGLKLDLSLEYNSASGDGDLGTGWSIGGLGSIERCTKSYAQDGTAAPISLTSGDAYCLNGGRLILVSGTYGANGSVYRTEIESFSKITAINYGNVVSPATGPEYFIIDTKDGLQYIYGDSGATSDIIGSSVYRWSLSRISDRNGNKFNIGYGDGYSVAFGSFYTVQYESASQFIDSVLAEYGARPAASVDSQYVAGVPANYSNLMSSLRTNTYRYKFTYETSSSTGRARLKTIQKCTFSYQEPEECISPTVITYQNGQVGVATSAISVTSSSPKFYGAYDLNGDGRSDLVYSQGSTVYVRLATSGGYAAAFSTGLPANNQIIFRDLLGNGKVGLFIKQSGTWNYHQWNGSSFSAFSVTAHPGSPDYQLTLAEIDGDGRSDLVFWQGDYIRVRLNTSANGVPSFSSTSFAMMHWSGNHGYPDGYTWGFSTPSPGQDVSRKGIPDVNGDGREDLVMYWAGTTAYPYDEFVDTEGTSLLLTGGSVSFPQP